MKSGNDSTLDIQALAVFVGEWKTEGEILNDAGGQPMRLEAKDTYEWFSGEHFLIHHVDGMMGSQKVNALEIFSADPNKDVFVSRSIDNGGQSSEYVVALDGTEWSIDGSTERFRGSFDRSFSKLEGQWEMLSAEKGWQKWMTITLTKLA